MKLSRERILSEAASTGFRPEVYEKVVHLLSLLQGIWSHPFLKNRLVLKGGTALNLFIFNLPRLSVDIDLNYIGALDKETMLGERPKIDSAIKSLSLDVHKIAAGKLCALLSRQTGRDLFDAHQLLIGPNAVLKKEGVSQRLD